MDNSPEQLHDLTQRCELCREDVRDRLAAFDRRLLALEIVVRGEDGQNGMKSQLNTLCQRFDQFEKRMQSNRRRTVSGRMTLRYSYLLNGPRSRLQMLQMKLAIWE